MNKKNKPKLIYTIAGSIAVYILLFLIIGFSQQGNKNENINVATVPISDKKFVSNFLYQKKLEEETLAKKIAEEKAEQERINRVDLPIRNQGWYITTPYGVYDSLRLGGHWGVDFGTNMETGWGVYPIAKGEVFAVYSPGEGPWYGCGYYVLVWHPQLDLTSMYCHLASYPTVVVGQQVDPDTLLGEAGTTGYSTGIHLHFALFLSQDVANYSDRLPSTIDPKSFFQKYGINI